MFKDLTGQAPFVMFVFYHQILKVFTQILQLSEGTARENIAEVDQ